MIDVLWIPVVIFFLLIFIAVTIEVLTNISSGLSEVIPFFNNYVSFENTFAYIFLGLYFGIPLVGIITAYLTGSEPVFLIISIAMLALGIFIFGILKAVSIEIINVLPNAKNFISNNVILSNAIEYYPFIMFMIGLGIMLVQVLKGYGQA